MRTELFDAARPTRRPLVSGAPSQSDERGVNLKEIIAILVQRRRVFACTVGVVLLTTMTYLLFTPRIYTATAELLLQPRAQRGAEQNATPDLLTADGIATVVDTQLRIITSKNVLLHVVAVEKLDTDPEFTRRRLISKIVRAVGSLLGTANGDRDERLLAYRQLRRVTSAKRSEKTFVLAVSVSSKDPAKSAKLTNAVVGTYLADQVTAAKRAVWQANLDQIGARVISSADPPDSASWPPRSLLLGLAAIAGIGLGVAVALLWDHFDERFYTARQAEEASGLPVLGVVPHLDLSGDGFARNGDHTFLCLHDAIRENSSGQDRKIVLVTSAAAGEGKTALTWNLAATAAKDGERVCVITVEPCHHHQAEREFAGSREDGSSRARSSDHIQIVSVPGDPGGLSLFVRKVSGASGDVLRRTLSVEMRRQAEAFDLVLLDCGIATDLRIVRLMAAAADAIVFVVGAGQTRVAELEKGIDAMRPAAPRIAGIILNASKPLGREAEPWRQLYLDRWYRSAPPFAKNLVSKIYNTF